MKRSTIRDEKGRFARKQREEPFRYPVKEYLCLLAIIIIGFSYLGFTGMMNAAREQGYNAGYSDGKQFADDEFQNGVRAGVELERNWTIKYNYSWSGDLIACRKDDPTRCKSMDLKYNTYYEYVYQPGYRWYFL